MVAAALMVDSDETMGHRTKQSSRHECRGSCLPGQGDSGGWLPMLDTFWSWELGAFPGYSVPTPTLIVWCSPDCRPTTGSQLTPG